MTDPTTRAEEGAKEFGIRDECSDRAATVAYRVDDALLGGMLSYDPDGKPCLTWQGVQIVGQIFDEELDAAESRAASAEAEVERLTKEKSEALAMSDAHRNQLQDALDEIGRLNDPLLRDMRLENGEISMNVAGPIVERLALAMTGWFRESGAENYVEMNLNARDNVDDRYCVTVQRVSKQSPHQLREAAEASASAFRDRVAVLEDLITGAVFHFFCCGPGIHADDECGQLVPAMADLAKAVEFSSDPATNAEIAAVPVAQSTARAALKESTHV